MVNTGVLRNNGAFLTLDLPDPRNGLTTVARRAIVDALMTGEVLLAAAMPADVKLSLYGKAKKAAVVKGQIPDPMYQGPLNCLDLEWRLKTQHRIEDICLDKSRLCKG